MSVVSRPWSVVCGVRVSGAGAATAGAATTDHEQLTTDHPAMGKPLGGGYNIPPSFTGATDGTAKSPDGRHEAGHEGGAEGPTFGHPDDALGRQEHRSDAQQAHCRAGGGGVREA